MHRLVLVVAGLLPIAAWAADPSMTRIEFRLVGKDIAPGTFAATPRTMWRAGDCCIRIEEAADPEHNIHGVIVTREPDTWLWNLYDNSARHVTDPGPTFNVTAPIFPQAKSATLTKLQFGHELDYFAQHHARQQPDRRVDGVDVRVQSLVVDGHPIELLIRKDNGRPFEVSLLEPKEGPGIRYEAFESGLAFDAKLFELPSRVKVSEAK